MSKAFRAWHAQNDPKQPTDDAIAVMENERKRHVATAMRKPRKTVHGKFVHLVSDEELDRRAREME